MAGNQEHIRHSKFRSFYSARTIFLDFSLFRRGQRAGDLLKGFVLRDATLSGYTGVEEPQIMLVWHGGEVEIPQFRMALGWGGGWAPLSSPGTGEAELRAPLSLAFAGKDGHRAPRRAPVSSERCPCFGAGPRGSGASDTGRVG